MTDEQHLAPEAPLLDPERNCWRVETAHRAACIVDEKAYFSLAKQAMLQARAATSVVLDEVTDWQNQPLEAPPEQCPGAAGLP